MNNIATKIQVDAPDQTTIFIDGQRIEQFSNESISLHIDRVGNGFSFTAPFFPGTKIYRDIYRPFGYQSFQLYTGEDLKINGTIESISPGIDSSQSTVTVQGRSKTGVIVDCSFEQGDKMEFKNADLNEIANTVISKFGLKAIFPDGAGAIFEQAGSSSPISIIFDFLQNLARQRSLLINQTPAGDLLFEKAKTKGNPVAELIEGQQGLVLSAPAYNGTDRFSDYNVYGQEHGKNDNFASLNDSSISIKRSKALHANDTNQGNIKQAVIWSLTSDIANAINVPVGFEGWLRPDGKIWDKNELILLHAPSIMIYKPSVFLIKSVSFTSDANSKSTLLNLTLPGAYSGIVPEVFPWDE